MKRLLALGILGGFLFFSLTILASVPNLINYQGRLTNDVGNPITTATTVRFSLYQGGSAGTAGSGTLVYEEDASVTPDNNGVFDHTIGSGTVIYGTLDSTVFQTSSPVYLEITVDPAGVADTLLPRKQVVTVGYSFKSELADDADTVDGLHASAFAPFVHNHDADYVNEGQADSVTSSMIVDGTIVDADINASANIAASKIDTTGLDADLLDGVDSTGFVSTAGDNMTGTLQVNTSGAIHALYSREQSTSGYSHGLYAQSNSTLGTGVTGVASASSGTTYGVYGESHSASGYGVYGRAANLTGTNYGLYGRSDGTSGYAVYGWASATTGTNYGVSGRIDSPEGYGVHGWAFSSTGTNYGVFGKSNSTDGFGVYGLASSSSGMNYGVYGKSNSTAGRGVYAEAPYMGVFGYASASSGLNYGIYGKSYSTSGYGVYGTAPTYGVYGYSHATSGTNYGVYGRSASTSGYGVVGAAPTSGGTNYGVLGSSASPSGYGVYGDNYGGGFAVYASGNAHVTGNLTVGGSKPCVQPIDDGKKVLLYAMESPEIWFEDFGTGKLVNGRAVVPIERVFVQTANTEAGYLVFLTPIGEWQGLYISRQDKDSFEVREQGGDTSNISFYYRIVAKRRGYEDVRFEEFTEPEASPERPKLPIETKEAKVKQPQRR